MHCVAVFVDVLHSIAFNCVHCGVSFGWDYTINKQENCITISESKGRFFLQNESIRIDSHNESNRFESRIGMLYCRYITRTVALPSRSCQSELDIWSRFDTIHAALTQRLDELDQLHDRQHNDAIRPTVRARLRATTRDNIHFAECRYLFIIRAPASHGIVGFVVLGNWCWWCENCLGTFYL